MDTDEWPQYLITFADRTGAEHAGTTVLAPGLREAAVDQWWFLRKHPAWRIRIPPHTPDSATKAVERLLADATAAGHAVGWKRGIYEPETLAFGGPEGIAIAHRLAHADSVHALDYLGTGSALAGVHANVGRREIALLLATALLRGAHLEWFEQGDVWAKVAQLRPVDSPPGVGPEQREKTRMLLGADITRLAGAGQVLSPADDWLTAFHSAGQALAELNTAGQLQRGLRAVLTHHILFAWNRLGLTATDQNALSRLATAAVMHDPEDDEPSPVLSVATTTVNEVNHPMTPTKTNDTATQLREALVDQLVANGTVRTPAIEAALRATPRHLFVPDFDLAEAYKDDAVYTKQDANGVSISAASQPTIVAMMLEQQQAQPGQTILELGAGTGYNAALMATLVGPSGRVTTIDIDQDIVDGARRGLLATGHRNVDVFRGDGAVGYPDNAPYDQIIATVGAWDLPAAWVQQLAPDGRLVVPLRIRGSVSRSIVLRRDGDILRSTNSQMSTFMPLRGGIADDPRRVVHLTSDGSVQLQLNQEQTTDTDRLAGVLDTPAHEVWTGVTMAGQESFEYLDLWLTCTLPGAFSRMPVHPEAARAGIVRPQFGWGSWATASEGNLAYLTLRPTETDGQRVHEIGVIGHGPTGAQQADQVAAQINAWNQDYRGHDVEFAIAPHGTALTGQFVFDEPNNQLAITWQ
ncbi:methyltransferase, FxLD system [Kribbella catacumbae]|uniref:methyltransferase, FxLD system n=1 Tax=Kribbella catacumbae TaxID=460086 RepID=UPI00037EA958|nr:methyltransferase, FxLD system [Kribbella catacumbae]